MFVFLETLIFHCIQNNDEISLKTQSMDIGMDSQQIRKGFTQAKVNEVDPIGWTDFSHFKL